MTSKSVKTLPLAVFLFCCGYLSLYLITHPHIDASRDAQMFRKSVDTTRTIHLRTDFPSFYYAGRAALSRQSMYDPAYRERLASADRVVNHVLPYLYPPFLADVCAPVAMMSPLDAQRCWDVIGVFLFGTAAMLTLMTPLSSFRSSTRTITPEVQNPVAGAAICVLMVLIFPFANNVSFGQSNFLVLFLLCAAFYAYYGHASGVLAGIFLALAALVKITPALILLFFILNRNWNVLKGFCAGILLGVATTFVVGGATQWADFFAFVPSTGYARGTPGGFHPMIAANFSLAGYFLRVFSGNAILARLLAVLTAVLLLAALLYHHLKYGARGLQGYILPYSILMVIGSPVAWLHHLVYLYPGGVLFMREVWQGVSERGSVGTIGALVLILVTASYDFQTLYPLITVGSDFSAYFTSLNLYMLLILFAVSLRILKRRALSKEPETTVPS